MWKICSGDAKHSSFSSLLCLGVFGYLNGLHYFSSVWSSDLELALQVFGVNHRCCFLVLLLVIFFLVLWPEPLVRVASWDCGQKCLVKFDELFSVGTMKKNDLKLKSLVFLLTRLQKLSKSTGCHPAAPYRFFGTVYNFLENFCLELRSLKLIAYYYNRCIYHEQAPRWHCIIILY